MEYIVGFLLGLAFSTLCVMFKIIYKKYISKKDKKLPEKFTGMRGLYTNEYSLTVVDKIANTKTKNTFDVTFEVYEIERKNTIKRKVSKLGVCNISAHSEYVKNKYDKYKLIELVNDKWVDTDDVDWFDQLRVERMGKL